MIAGQDKTLKETLKEFGDAFEFDDELWMDVTQRDADGNLIYSDESIMFVLSKNLINLYPELHLLNNLSVSKIGADVFRLYYENALNIEKVDNSQFVKFATKDFANKFEYLNTSSRRSVGTSFEIDSTTKTMNVETTEQLLHAVQYGYRPNFVGNSSVAEMVYNNAKSVLVAIIGNNMTDLEKTTAIFNWLSYAINLNYESTYALNEQMEKEDFAGDVSKYGTRKEYYLEGLFQDLLIEEDRTFDGEFYFGNKAGTSDLFAKAFSLLCSIEGIETKKINGTYSYISESETISVRHSWNKINLQVSEGAEKAWFVVDLLFSDTLSIDSLYSTSLASHMFYLTTAEQHESFYDMGNLLYNSNTILNISVKTNQFDPTKDLYACNTIFNYTADSNFKLNTSEIQNFIKLLPKNDVTYSKCYNKEEKYHLFGQAGFGANSINAFVFNNFVYGYNTLIKNGTGKATIEFC